VVVSVFRGGKKRVTFVHNGKNRGLFNQIKMRFETPEDIKNELNVIKRIAGANQFNKLGPHDLDFEITGKAYIEIKCYKRNSTDFENVIVSCIKLTALQSASRTMPTFLFIQFADELLYINVNDIEGYIKRGGRKPRPGSTNDIEFLCYVEKAKFKVWNKN
jgi:hypothetical protein